MEDDNYNFDECSPTTVLMKESKQTMYMVAPGSDPLSPKLLPPEREINYRNTQPSFHINVEQTERTKVVVPPKTRVETPKLETPAKSKVVG